MSVSPPKLNAPYHSVNWEAFLHWASECIIQPKFLLVWFWEVLRANDLIGVAIGVVLGQQKDISKDLVLCEIQVHKHVAWLVICSGPTAVSAICFAWAHNNMIRTVINNGHVSETYTDSGFTFSHQLVLEDGADFKGLHKLKCLKQATGQVDQWMRSHSPQESFFNAWSRTGHLDILDRRSDRRLSCEKLLASGPENATDGTALRGYGLVKSTSWFDTSQSHSCFGSLGPL